MDCVIKSRLASTQWTLGPYAVRIWSRIPKKSGRTKPSWSTEWPRTFQGPERVRPLRRYAPREVIFPHKGMASEGSASWDVQGGTLRIYPSSAYTGKAWTSQEQSRFREAVTRRMGLSYSTV